LLQELNTFSSHRMTHELYSNRVDGWWVMGVKWSVLMACVWWVVGDGLWVLDDEW